MNTSASLLIRLQPKQTELWKLWDESPVTRIGSGGARGGAKSGGGRRCMLLRRLKYANTPGLILRRTYPELYKSHIVKLFEEYPETRHWYNEQRKEMVFPNGSRLFFGSAEHEKDMSAFYSAEFADIMPDEAQEFSQHELEQLSGSNRCTSNPAITPKMVMTFMPGMSEAGLPPIGLPYLKRVFVEQNLLPEEKNEKWAFVPARAWDNIEWARKELGWYKDAAGQWQLSPDGVSEEEYYSWPDADRQRFFIECTEYGRKLAALTNPGLRDAWLFGKFDTFQGQYFQNWKPERHIISRAEALERIKPWHKRWASGDWGFDHPCSITWHAQDEHGRVITYREMQVRQMHEDALGKEIGRLSLGEKLQGFPFSWDAGKLSKRSDPKFPKSISQMLSDALPDWMPKPHPAESSPGSRIAGARLMSNLLDADIGGLPGWQIVREDCPKLIECIPSLIRDPENPEDVYKIDYSENMIGDDSYDSARMGLQWMLGAAIVPAVVIAERRVEAYAKSRNQEVAELDINTVAQLHRRALHQEQRRRGMRRGGLGRIWRPQVGE